MAVKGDPLLPKKCLVKGPTSNHPSEYLVPETLKALSELTQTSLGNEKQGRIDEAMAERILLGRADGAVCCAGVWSPSRDTQSTDAACRGQDAAGGARQNASTKFCRQWKKSCNRRHAGCQRDGISPSPCNQLGQRTEPQRWPKSESPAHACGPPHRSEVELRRPTLAILGSGRYQ